MRRRRPRAGTRPGLVPQPSAGHHRQVDDQSPPVVRSDGQILTRLPAGPSLTSMTAHDNVTDEATHPATRARLYSIFDPQGECLAIRRLNVSSGPSARWASITRHTKACPLWAPPPGRPAGSSADVGRIARASARTQATYWTAPALRTPVRQPLIAHVEASPLASRRSP